MISVKRSPSESAAPGGERLSGAGAARLGSLIGTEIAGRYRLDRVIGRGGMAVVYAGEHLNLQRSVAVKVLDATWASDRDATERFLNEARTASSFTHPNIVSVLDLDVLADGRPYLVMPMVEGTDLTVLLAREGRLAPRRAVALLKGVASALDLVHAKGLLHRDIKPENLMHVVREDGSESVLVLDFGIAGARFAGIAQPDGTWSGTPEFMPPEAFAGAPSDPSADVYALATVAFELISGALPFEPGNVALLIRSKRRERPRTLSEAGHKAFDSMLEQVIARGLARSPSDRYRSAGELLQDLEAACAQLAHDPSPPIVNAPRLTRGRTLFQAGIVSEDDASALDAQTRETQSMRREGDESGAAGAPVGERPPAQSGVRTTAEGAERARALAADPWLYKWQLPHAEAPRALPGQPSRRPSQMHVTTGMRSGRTTLRSARKRIGPGARIGFVVLAGLILTVGPQVVRRAFGPLDAPRPPRAVRVPERVLDPSADPSATAQAPGVTPASLAAGPAQKSPGGEPESAAPRAARDATDAPGRANERAVQLAAQAKRALRAIDPRQALQLFDAALRADPRYAPAWRDKGELLDRLGRTGEAADAYREYLQLDPTGADASAIRKRLWQLSPR